VSARFLLDTNIVSDLVRNPQGRAAAKIAEVGEDAVATYASGQSRLPKGAWIGLLGERLV
jgi:tRNA(fMet)-specific endonuclease VapC